MRVARRKGSRPTMRRKAIPLRLLLPNILTTLALCSGLSALHFALEGDWDRALSAIVAAAIFDVLDGGAARLLRGSSKFGAVLDSLSDFLSFGVAPALILHQWMLSAQGAPGLAATMTYALCAAMRLARFTSARKLPPGSPLARFFVGLPTPAAAGIVLIPVMLEASKWASVRTPWWLVAAHVLLVAWLMISKRPCFSFKRVRVRRGFVVPLLVAIGFVAVGAVKDAWLTLTLITAVYLLSIPVSSVLHAKLKSQAATAAAGRADGGSPLQSRGDLEHTPVREPAGVPPIDAGTAPGPGARSEPEYTV